MSKKMWAVFVESRNGSWDMVWKFRAGPFSSEARAKVERDKLDRQHVVSTFAVKPYDGREEIPVR